MGMYDSVIFSCPNCGNKIEFQSKAGVCELEHYSPDRIPCKVAADILHDVEYCSKCSQPFMAVFLEEPPTSVQMEIIPYE